MDKTSPTLEIVELKTNNKNSYNAKIGDELIIKVTASEGIVAKDILINGNSINYVDLTEKQFYVNYFFKDSDPDGVVNFQISFSDSSGNQGEIVKSSTDGKKYFLIKHLPQVFLQDQLFQKEEMLFKTTGILQILT